MKQKFKEISIIPLGGLGEFGLNMMVYETKDDIIVVDTGFMLPGSDIPGVELIFPDISYLVKRQKKVRGILLTHGHEDHIGALFYVLKQLDVPVYGTQLTLAFARGRLREYGVLGKAKLNRIAPGDTINLGRFTAEFIHVTHSMPDAVAIAIRTPAGVIVHTGDFKFDTTPVDGNLTDVHTLNRLGSEGVQLLLSDSTNATRPGQTPSERSIYKTIDNIFHKTEQRLFLCTFSSSIHRIQQFIDLAVKHRRLVAVAGRSLIQNVRIASELGYLDVKPEHMIDARDVMMFKPHEVVILSTGSQGEQRATLPLIAADKHPFLKVEPNDTIVLSTRIISGNEKSVGNIINELMKRGAKIFHERNADVHVSGHAASDDLKLMMNLLRPKFFIPMHGEYQNLMRHAELAESVGISHENIKVVEDGELIKLTPKSCEILGRNGRSGRVLVDGKLEFELEDSVLRDRITLSQDGMVIPIIVMNGDAGALATEPEIVSRGFVHMDNSEKLMNKAKQITRRVIENLSAEQKAETETVQDEIRFALRRFFAKQMQRSPLVLPVVMQV